MNEKQHFRNFLKLCQSNGITVWADPNLMCDKQTTGYWNGADHITVDRPGQKMFSVSPTSPDARISKFIDGSPNIQWEMAVLLHEYGHWFFKHPHLSTVDPNIGYQHEVDAWDKGEEIGRCVGITDFSVFYIDRDKELLRYKTGLGLSRT